MTEIAGGIEAVLSEADVKFLAENIGALPDFLRSSEAVGHDLQVVHAQSMQQWLTHQARPPANRAA